jgi:prepilin-type N-terminal cleavage/methylation domain-containing protein
MKKNIPNTRPHCYACQKPCLQRLHLGQGCICCGLAKRCRRAKYQIPNTNPGFTLIELLVSIFIFSLITVAIVSVFVSTTKAHQKARAIKFVKENAEFAISSIAKDVRMGKIEGAHADGNKDNYFMVVRNRNQQKVCYRITVNELEINESVPATSSACPAAATNYKELVNLSGSGMSFDSDSGFYSMPTDTTDPGQNRGWVEINLNIVPEDEEGMETDSINVQTTVSSRDYGWEEI